MIDYEVGKISEMIQKMNPFLDFKSSFTFYYDETNNIKKFYLKEDDFNYSFHSNFILGGVAYEGEKPDISDMIPGLRLQPNVGEIKLKHIATGEFADCLRSAKLNHFLKYMLDSSLYVHYSSLNILYYSLVDIVDSAIANSKISQELGPAFALHLKNDLYKLCKLEIDQVIPLFYAYQYPNIKKDSILDFISDLTSLFEDYEDDLEFHLGLTSLKQILRDSEDEESLPFIMDEEDYILLKDFTGNYLRPLYTFKKSTHIFDREADIESSLNEYRITDNGIPLKNYRFEDSKNDLLIQASDVLVGLRGKLSTFINTHTPEEIEVTIRGLNPIQLDNLDTYLDLINKSDSKNAAFIHHSDSLFEIDKMRLIFDLRDKN